MPSMSTRVVSPTLAGRRVELDRLRAARDRASGGVPSTVLISGEAGVGKTRLVTEARLDGPSGMLRLIVGGADRAWRQRPAIRTLRRGISVAAGRRRSRADHEAAGARRRRPRAVCPRPRRVRPQTPFGPHRRGVDSRPRLFEVVHDCWAALALETPVAARARGPALGRSVVARRSSCRRPASSLGRAAGPDRDLPVGRLDRRHPLLPLLAILERLPYVERIDLSRLDRDEVHAQIAGILGTVPGARSRRQVVARSDGNPFFVEELLARVPRGTRRSGVPPTLQEYPARTAVRPGRRRRSACSDRGGHRSAAEHDLLASVQAYRAEPDLSRPPSTRSTAHPCSRVEADGGPATTSATRWFARSPTRTCFRPSAARSTGLSPRRSARA